MKKLIALLPLLAGGAWAGTTIVAGNQTEPAYVDALAKINEQSPVPFIAESYEKGLLKSTAITKIMKSKEPDAEVALRLKHEISHSTVGMDDAGARVGKSSIRTTVLFGEDIDPDLQKFLDSFDGEDPLELVTLVGVGGAADNKLLFKPFDMEQDDVRVINGGGEINFSIGSDQAVKGDGKIKPVTASTAGAEVFASGDMDIQFDVEKHSSGFYHGTQSIRVASAKGVDPNTGQKFNMSDLVIEGASDFSGDTGNGKFGFSIGDIETQLPINSISVEGAMEGMSTQALVGLKQMMDKMKAMPKNDPAAAEQIMSDYMQNFTELFQGGAKMTYDVKLTNDGGDVVADFDLGRLDGAPAISNEMTVGDLIKSLAGELRLTADGGAVDLTPMGFMLQAPPASDFIAFDGKQYNGKAVLADNVIEINGNAFPLEMMLGGMMQMPLGDAMGFLQ